MSWVYRRPSNYDLKRKKKFFLVSTGGGTTHNANANLSVVSTLFSRCHSNLAGNTGYGQNATVAFNAKLKLAGFLSLQQLVTFNSLAARKAAGVIFLTGQMSESAFGGVKRSGRLPLSNTVTFGSLSHLNLGGNFNPKVVTTISFSGIRYRLGNTTLNQIASLNSLAHLRLGGLTRPGMVTTLFASYTGASATETGICLLTVNSTLLATIHRIAAARANLSSVSTINLSGMRQRSGLLSLSQNSSISGVSSIRLGGNTELSIINSLLNRGGLLLGGNIDYNNSIGIDALGNLKLGGDVDLLQVVTLSVSVRPDFPILLHIPLKILTRKTFSLKLPKQDIFDLQLPTRDILTVDI